MNKILFNRAKLFVFAAWFLFLTLVAIFTFCSATNHTAITWRHRTFEIGEHGAIMFKIIGYIVVSILLLVISRIIIFMYRNEAIIISKYGVVDNTRMFPVTIRWGDIVCVEPRQFGSGVKAKSAYIAIVILSNGAISGKVVHKINGLPIKNDYNEVVDIIRNYLLIYRGDGLPLKGGSV